MEKTDTFVVHVMFSEKFTESFIEFMSDHFSTNDHLYLIRPTFSYPVPSKKNVIFLKNRFLKALNYFKFLRSADKVIIHGLVDFDLMIFLLIYPRLLKKCYWVMWGGDLYVHNQESKDWRWKVKELIRQAVISRIGHLVTYVPGDVELARQWYGARGEYHECLMYPSNLYKDYSVPAKQGKSLNLLVGNSGDSSNNHFEVFDKIDLDQGEDFKIYCPLSYGDENYIQSVVSKGNEMFGSKFIPLLDFMPFAKYLELLGQIDIAIFNHKRQQGMGNIITLLGLGKIVYMRGDVTSWKMFCSVGVKVFDVANFYLPPSSGHETEVNKQMVRNYFSEKTLFNQWKRIFT